MKFNFKSSILFLFFVILLSCNSNSTSKPNQQITKISNKSSYGKQIEEIGILKQEMIDYMNFSKPKYTMKEIENCEFILIEFINNIDKTTTKEEGMKMIQSTIFQLNELNKNCKYDLIETNERERIAKIMIDTGYLKGYNSLNEDITEQWREW